MINNIKSLALLKIKIIFGMLPDVYKREERLFKCHFTHQHFPSLWSVK